MAYGVWLDPTALNGSDKSKISHSVRDDSPEHEVEHPLGIISSAARNLFPGSIYEAGRYATVVSKDTVVSKET
ncbi:MAG TPA: hypothetical protein VFU31_07325 [Candidatus Binatia bacterium]|nr:hypothetical protein [Candidatus Binatia bacterium]